MQFLTNNPVSDAFNSTTKRIEDSRAAQLRQERENYEFSQIQKAQQQASAMDKAIRESYAQAYPVEQSVAQQQVPSAPTEQVSIPQMPQRPTGLTQSQGRSFAGQAMPQQQQAEAPQLPFRKALAQRLSGIEGGGSTLMQMEASDAAAHDAKIEKVFEMAANGNVAEAQFYAERAGLEIPSDVLNNAELTQAMNLAKKAYPDEPQKGQAFVQTFMRTQGNVEERMNAGIAVGGRPTTAAQREVGKQIAILKFKAANPQLSENTQNRYMNVGNAGLVDLYHPSGAPTVVVAGGSSNDREKQIIELAAELNKNSFGTIDPDTALLKAREMVDSVYVPQGNSGILPQTQMTPAPQNTSQTPLPVGTMNNPIIARTQADIDNAPAGAIINVNGQLMQK